MKLSTLRHLAALTALTLPLLAAAQANDAPGGLPGGPPGGAPGGGPNDTPPPVNLVPEPGSMLLAGVAIAGAIVARRRRK
jgi:hypothetical protein